jgi:hypothetical protein
MTGLPPSNRRDCPKCHRMNVVVRAISTETPSFYCRACGQVFEVDESTPQPNTRGLSQSGNATVTGL